MSKQSRFVEVYSQGTFNTTKIFVDTETGANYLFRQSGYGAGLTPLLDSDGAAVITAQAQIPAIVKKFSKSQKL